MMQTIRTTTDADNILTIWMDAPDKPINTCSSQFLNELSEAIASAERQSPRAIIFASAKSRSFNAGADLYEIRVMKKEQISGFLSLGQSLFDRIARLNVPTVAAINGDCMGGGFELSLACRYRVAADDGSISIGLPEIKLGLIPAWGGTTRLPRMIGLRRALPILLAGKTMPPRKAQRSGLIDEVVRPEALMAAAKRVVLSGRPKQSEQFVDRALARLGPLRNRFLRIARERTLQLTHGNYPAPIKVLDVVKTGYEQGVAASLQAERQALLELADSDVGRNLLRLFFLRQGAKKWAAQRVSAAPHDVKRAAVIGGGTMGSGIVHAFVRAGIPVRLIEVNPSAVSAALNRIKRMLDDDVSAGRMDRLAARHALNRVSPTTEWIGLELADFVVEAVAETIEVKRDVFSRLDRATRPSTILATNTSALSVAEMAQATLHPERVIGLHFFNPVPKMPLVEIVRAPHSDDASLATAISLSGKLGKTPVLVTDSPGFIINRILVPYLAEALLMASEGVPITEIDEAMKRWGMPMGPFELLDEIGLDIAYHVLESLTRKTPPPPNVVTLFAQANEKKWLGTKSGKGFYIHSTRRKRSAMPQVNEELLQTLATGVRHGVPENETDRQVLRESIQWRLILPMVNETARLLEEEVTDSTDAVDLATVLGLGLAPFRGGIVQFANTVGAEEIVRRLDGLTTRHGERFTPPELLREVARTHRCLAHFATFAQQPQNSTEHTITT
jgi:3-hydroxyacyl-CoA dehydrogenase/enoyl-CoA hydratase/3-hydroxybutyryl-CoA epimerase